MMSKNQPILFNRPGDGNFWLTNFQEGYPIITKLPTKITKQGEIASDSGFIEIDGKKEFTWYSSEHLYQALKFPKDIELIKKIINNPDPQQAQELGKPMGRWDWKGHTNYCLNAMRWVLKEKFTQHPELKKLLINTKNALLVENAGNRDPFWGNGSLDNGKDGYVNKNKGKNWLGELLMELRKNLQTGSDTPLPPRDNRTPPLPVPRLTPPPPPPQTPSFISANDLQLFDTWVKNELNKQAVKNTDLSPELQNYLVQASKFTKISELETHKDKIINDIKRIVNNRDKNNQLFQLRDKTRSFIQQLLTEYNFQNTKLDKSYHNWENQLEQCGSEEKIKLFQEKLEQEIKERVKEHAGEKIQNLLQEAQNKNTYEELKTVLDELEKFRSTDIYIKNENKIKELNKKLSEINSNRFQDDKKEEVDEFLKKNGLKDSDLPEDLQKKFSDLKNKPNLTFEKVNETTNETKDFVFKCEAKKKINDLLAQVKKVTSEEEKKHLAKKFADLKNGNKYERLVYSECEKIIQKYLREWGFIEEEIGKVKNNKFSRSAKIAICGGVITATILIPIIIIKFRRRK